MFVHILYDRKYKFDSHLKTYLWRFNLKPLLQRSRCRDIHIKNNLNQLTGVYITRLARSPLLTPSRGGTDKERKIRGAG